MNTLQIYRLAVSIAGESNKLAVDLDQGNVEKEAAKEQLKTLLTEALAKLNE